MIESAIRVHLAHLLPIDVLVGLSTAILVVAFVGLRSWAARRVARAEAHGAGHPGRRAMSTSST